MVQISILALTFAAATASVNGAPFTKRIAQVISDSTTQWEKACDAAGGGQQCNQVAVNSFGTLLANAGACDQQNAADNMIDLAKQHNNDPNMIKFAQIFAQQPRNSPNSQSIPYCQQAPKNTELNGLFQCQFQGNSKTFVGSLSPGQNGTVPFGMSSPLNPAGSCPANPSGPIADGTQLVDKTQNPGVGSTGGSSNSTGSTNSTSTATGASNSTSTASPGAGSSNATASAALPGSGSGSSTNTTDAGSMNGCSGGNSMAPSASVPSNGSSGSSAMSTGGSVSGSGASASSAPASGSSNVASASASSAAPAASGSSGSSGFKLQNGQDAQKQNAQFAGLNANSSCQEGQQACVNGGFAQCVQGKFQITQCGSGLTCAALPLVNSAGTSVTCTTQADAQARIQATGATGGVTGSS